MRCCHEHLNIVTDQVLNNLLMTDEANFYLCGYVSTQHCWYWAFQNPQELFLRLLQSEEVVVWCGLTSSGMIGPYFFEDKEGNAVTVHSQRYIHIRTFLALSYGNVVLHRKPCGSSRMG